MIVIIDGVSVVKVYGVIGPEREDRPLWKSNWLPPGDEEFMSHAARMAPQLPGSQFQENGYEEEARRLLDELDELVWSQPEPVCDSCRCLISTSAGS